MKNIFFTILLSNIFIACLSGCVSVSNTINNKINESYGVKVYSDIKSHAIVDSKVSELNEQYGEENLLIVLDIDNTVLTSDTDLGSDLWYRWQRGELENVKPSNDERVECLFEDAIGLLYELGTQKLTEEGLDDTIRRWQATNTVFSLTSRSPKYRSATERELLFNKIDFSRNPLKKNTGEELIFRINPPVEQHQISYIDGVMMTTGLDKGEMLKRILERSGSHFRAIVFVDDSHKNIINISNWFKDNDKSMVHLFHYTQVPEELDHKRATKMDQDWDTLMNTFNTIFPQRAERYKEGGCLWVQ